MALFANVTKWLKCDIEILKKQDSESILGKEYNGRDSKFADKKY